MSTLKLELKPSMNLNKRKTNILNRIAESGDVTRKPNILLAL